MVKFVGQLKRLAEERKTSSEMNQNENEKKERGKRATLKMCVRETFRYKDGEENNLTVVDEI